MNTRKQDTGGDQDVWQVTRPTGTELSKDGLFTTIWRRRWIVVLAMIASLAAAVIYLTQVTPTYASTSRLYVEQTGPKIITDNEGVMTQSKNYLFTQCELLKSTPILSDALAKPGMRQLRSLAGAGNPVAFLKRELVVEVGKKDDLISVTFESRYSQEAASLVNNIVDAYVTYHTKQKRSTAWEVLKILQKEKTKRDAELVAKLQEMLEFKQANGALSFENYKGNIVVQRLARLSEALTTAQLDVIDAKAAEKTAGSVMKDRAKLRQVLEALQAKGRFTSYDSLDARLRGELSRLELELVSLDREYTAQHPAVRAHRKKIDGLTKRIAAHERTLTDAYREVARQRLLQAREKEAEIQATFDQQKKAARDLNLKEAEYAVLRTSLRRTEKLCDILDSRMKEVNVTEDSGALNISILEVARAASTPASPKIAHILAIAVAGGLALGCFLGLLHARMDQSFSSAEDISACLGVPVLGTVPSMGSRGDDMTRGQSVVLAPSSPSAEAYRAIRTAVYFGVPGGEAKTMLVTSPDRAEGKTTLVSNLALSMAQAGQRTLVLDADFRKPMQHVIFQVAEEPGLTNLLVSRDSYVNAIQASMIEHLHVLPAGPIPPNPSEMLSSQAFANLLKNLSERYDRIVVDSPPVMAVADARIIAALCDVTLLVLRAESSTRRLSGQALDNLLRVGARVLGVVVNNVPRGDDRYGYYGYPYDYARTADKKRQQRKAGKDQEHAQAR